ncbi:MAG: hypothetical protein JSW16_05180, partial [Dehalococcoidales bacterium]
MISTGSTTRFFSTKNLETRIGEHGMQHYLSDDRDYEVWMLLNQASEAMFKAREKELNGNGVTAMEATALFIIQAIGNQATPAEISR